MVFPFVKKFEFWGNLGPPYCGIGATIRISRQTLCLPYAGFNSNVYCLLLTFYFLQCIVFCLLSAVYSLLSTAYCILPLTLGEQIRTLYLEKVTLSVASKSVTQKVFRRDIQIKIPQRGDIEVFNVCG